MRPSAAPAALAALAAAGARGHGAVSFPRPRNSADADLPPWSDWSYPKDPIRFTENGRDTAGACPIAAKSGEKNALKSNGQACYWFSNGCTIGCDRCDGTQNHVGHEMTAKFMYIGEKPIPPWTPKPGTMVLDPNKTKHLAIKSICANPTTNATICDSALRTVNTQAACGSAEDIFYFSPWRAPGSAPVIDSCGSAGGRFPWQGMGEAGASFQNSSVARQGDMGSNLPAMPPQATWRAGSNVEVGWTLMAQHGGGYAYRLAPADEPLTEETFRKLPLDFVGPSILRWDGNRSTQLEFNATRVSTGTVPAGSMWSKNPIPRGPYQWLQEGPAFEPVCEESEACKATTSVPLGPWPKDGVCRCSGSSNGAGLLPNLEIVDVLKIPADLKPGRYVLGWRWDCEETDQVWASCSDVAVTAAD